MQSIQSMACRALVLIICLSAEGAASAANKAANRQEDSVLMTTQAMDGGTLWVATADLARADMVIVPQDGRGGIRVHEAVRSIRGLAGINGGFFSPEHLPTGLEIIAGNRRGRLAKSQRLLVKDSQGWDVIHATVFRNDTAWEYALQSGPILIERPGILGIRQDGGPVARRSAVCVGANSVTIAATDAPITLYRWAQTLLGLHHTGRSDCLVALNLDGGPSTGFYAGDRLPSLAEDWPVANVLVLKPR